MEKMCNDSMFLVVKSLRGTYRQLLGVSSQLRRGLLRIIDANMTSAVSRVHVAAGQGSDAWLLSSCVSH